MQFADLVPNGCRPMCSNPSKPDAVGVTDCLALLLLVRARGLCCVAIGTHSYAWWRVVFVVRPTGWCGAAWVQVEGQYRGAVLCPAAGRGGSGWVLVVHLVCAASNAPEAFFFPMTWLPVPPWFVLCRQVRVVYVLSKRLCQHGPPEGQAGRGLG